MKLISCLLAAFTLFEFDAVGAASCPCFTASDVRGIVRGFSDGAQRHGSTTYQFTLTNRKLYRTSDVVSNFNFEERQAYTCEATTLTEDFYDMIDPNRIFREINRRQHIACRDLLRYYTPASEEELQVLDNRIDSTAISLQNVGTGKYLTVASDGSIVTQELSGGPSSLAHQWALVQDECPTIGNSAAKDSTRTCFHLASLMDPDSIILGTNGGRALLHELPANILSVYILEPTQCYRTLSSCTLRLQVAYYGDRVVADIPPLELAVGSDQDLEVAEWVFDFV